MKRLYFMFTKFFMVILLMGLSVSTCNSQVLIALIFGDKLNSDRMNFGLNAGLNVSDFTDFDESSFGTGFQFGIFLDYKLNDKLIIRPELNAITNIKMGIDPYITGNDALDSVLTTVNVDRKLSYGSAAVFLKYPIGRRFQLETGPRGSLRFKAEDIFTADVVESEDLVYTRNIRDEVTLIDVGWAIGLGRKLFKGKGVYFSARYYYGFIDVLKDEPGNQNVSSFQFNASIPIVGKKKVDEKIQEAAEQNKNN